MKHNLSCRKIHIFISSGIKIIKPSYTVQFVRYLSQKLYFQHMSSPVKETFICLFCITEVRCKGSYAYIKLLFLRNADVYSIDTSMMAGSRWLLPILLKRTSWRPFWARASLHIEKITLIRPKVQNPGIRPNSQIQSMSWSLGMPKHSKMV